MRVFKVFIVSALLLMSSDFTRGSFEFVDSTKELRQLTEEEEDLVLVLWTSKTCKVPGCKKFLPDVFVQQSKDYSIQARF